MPDTLERELTTSENAKTSSGATPSNPPKAGGETPQAGEDVNAPVEQRQTDRQNQNLTPGEELEYGAFRQKLLEELGLKEPNEALSRIFKLHRQNIILNRVSQGAYNDYKTKAETLTKQLKEATARRFSADLGVPEDVIQDAVAEAEKEIGQELTPRMQERVAKSAAMDYLESNKGKSSRPTGRPDNNIPTAPGGGKPVFSRAQIADRAFYEKNREAIELAYREGRIR
jgi:hypothetical protein